MCPNWSEASKASQNKRFWDLQTKIKLCSQIYSVLNLKVHLIYINIKSRESVIAQLTLSTPIRLKPACRTLKFWMYSCSNFAWNFTFLSATEPGKSMSMNWQYAAPAKRKITQILGWIKSAQLTNLCEFLFSQVSKLTWLTPQSHRPFKGNKGKKTGTFSLLLGATWP